MSKKKTRKARRSNPKPAKAKRRKMPRALRAYAAKVGRRKGRGGRGRRGLLGMLVDVARGGTAALGGAVLSSKVRAMTANIHKGNPAAEAGVSAATALGLAVLGPKVARSLPIVTAQDAADAAKGAGLDAVFVGTARLRDAGKIPGVPGGRRGVLAGAEERAPSPFSGTDAMRDLVPSGW